MSTVRHRLAVLGSAAVLGAAGVLIAAAGATGAAAAVAAPASASRCGNGSLAVTRTYVDGGAGHSWMSLIYRNTTAHTCTVHGYPGLDAVSRKGAVIAHATRTLSGYGGGGHLRTVHIKPGGYASASVEWLNFNGRSGGSCRFGSTVHTIVAGTSRVHRLKVSVSRCQLQVHPTVAGTPGYSHFGPAQHDWIVGSKVDAAGTNLYLRKAEHQLRLAKSYPTQVKALAQLRSLPDTGLTHKQLGEARADVATLDGFFGTPGLYR